MMPSFLTRREALTSTDSGIESSTNNKSESNGDLENEQDQGSEKELLLTSVKKQVKQLMEEFVSRRYVHEYSSNVITLCATVESCLLLGLKRRVLGLFRESSSLALLEKISKQNSFAKLVWTKLVEERKQSCVLTNNNSNQQYSGFSIFSGNGTWGSSSLSGTGGGAGVSGGGGAGGGGALDSLSEVSFGSSVTSSISSRNSDCSTGTGSGVFNQSWSASSLFGFGSNNNSKTDTVGNEYIELHLKYLKKHHWIRLALMEKVLDKIVDYLVKNASRYYNKESIIGDPCDGYILMSLLCGPCSLEYSRARNPNTIGESILSLDDLHRSDATELVQRQRIQNQFGSTGFEPGKSPQLGYTRHRVRSSSGITAPAANSIMSTSSLFWNSGSNQNLAKPSFGVGLLNRQLKISSGSELISAADDDIGSRMMNTTLNSSCGRSYIESLHQGSNSVLLFGKNNVYSQPKDDLPSMPGYLSLHQNSGDLEIKWTPNVLMSGGLQHHHYSQDSIDRVEWSCAMIVWISKVVSIHCHRQSGKGDILVMVNRDGSQNPPLQFPPGGQLVTFLSCLENGLQPNARLDPPLWSMVNKDQYRHIDSPLPTQTPQSAVLLTSADKPKRKSIFMWSSTSTDNNELMSDSNCTKSFNWFRPPFRRLSIGNRKILSEESPKKITAISKENTEKDAVDTVLSTVDDKWQSDMIFRIVRSRKMSSRDSCSDIASDEDTTEVEIDNEDIFSTGTTSPNNPSIIDKPQPSVSSPTKLHYHQNSSPTITSSPMISQHSTISASSSPNWQQRQKSNDSALHYYSSRRTASKSTSSEQTLSVNLGKSSIRKLCSTMKKEILARAFYGWLAYCRNMKTIRSNLSQLVYSVDSVGYEKHVYCDGFTAIVWEQFKQQTAAERNPIELLRLIYWGGCDKGVRRKVWPYLLGVYDWNMTDKEVRVLKRKWERRYDIAVSEWMVVEAVIDDNNTYDVYRHQQNHHQHNYHQQQQQQTHQSERKDNDDEETTTEDDENKCILEMEKEAEKYNNERQDLRKLSSSSQEKWQNDDRIVITKKVLRRLKQNLHRIEKDVARCDRHFEFFSQTEKGVAHLNILHRIMCSWVWENLGTSYIQGMCDLLAPLLVVFEGDEEISYACFCKLMEKMLINFPIGENNQMDLNFSQMRTAVKILDSELLDHMQSHGDFTHFYFSYRWFLLDFKREFSYNDIFCLWELIWSAEKVTSPNFSLFVGLALFLSYRDVIIDNDMEFTDIIRFFNEMAENHSAQKVMDLSRELVEKLQILLNS